jgi:hypothetical protein
MIPTATRSWRREPWPWILMSGPALVIVAGIVTTWLAVTTSDGLVSDDYYKQGLAINRSIARDERARALGLTAMVQLSEERTHVRVFLRGAADAPPRLRLALVHRTRAGQDQEVTLELSAPGVYEGRLAAAHGASWRIDLSDEARSWRISGGWPAGEGVATLRPAGK